jgi:hypothetical protein
MRGAVQIGVVLASAVVLAAHAGQTPALTNAEWRAYNDCLTHAQLETSGQIVFDPAFEVCNRLYPLLDAKLTDKAKQDQLIRNQAALSNLAHVAHELGVEP